VLTLHGLTILAGDGGEMADPATDIRWCTHRVGSLPSEPGAGNPIAIVRGEQTETGIAIEHIFGYDGRVRCRFRVEADGSAVTAWATPEVSDRDIFSLLAEPVMRTILLQRDMLSFHAAALAKNGRAILIMAAKGAGKSTLSWALQRQGWQLLADDLVRTEKMVGNWSAFAGHRDTKLTPGAASALGYGADSLLPRFDDIGPAVSAALFDKVVVAPLGPPPPATAVPLAAILFLTPRDPNRSSPLMHRIGPIAGIRLLVEHATPDPVAPGSAPPLKIQREIGHIASGVPLAKLTLPDRLDLLSHAATSLEEGLGGLADQWTN